MQAFQASDYSIQVKLISGDIAYVAARNGLTPELFQAYFSRSFKTGSVPGALKDANNNVTQEIIIPLHAISYVVYTYSPT